MADVKISIKRKISMLSSSNDSDISDHAEDDPGNGYQLKCWYPEDEGFWRNFGRKIAYRALPPSSVNNMMGFLVWTLPSVLSVMLQTAHDADPSVYAFDGFVTYEDKMNPTREEIAAHSRACSLIAVVGGLAGASCRSVNGFMLPLTGTRMHNVMNTLFCIPAMGLLAIGLMDPDVSFYTIVLACFLLGGIGGGAFCSSMASISFFFPTKHSGFALGVNAGVGNLGVGFGQIMFPLFASVPILGMSAISDDARSPFGGQVWPGQSAWILLIVQCIFCFWAYKCTVTMPQHGTGIMKENLRAWVTLVGMGLLGSGLGVAILLLTGDLLTSAAMVIVRVCVLSLICIVTTIGLCYFCTYDSVRQKMIAQGSILRDKHAHIQMVLYIKTLGSFIGYSMAYPQLMRDTFGYLKDGSVNPAMVGVAARYAWLGPLCSALSRALGGWGSDRYGGANMTHYSTIVQVFSSLANGVIMMKAKERDRPEELFIPFMITYILLMSAAGSGNGSVFKQVAVLFPPEPRAPVLGYVASIASYCAAIFPAMFAAVEHKGTLMVILTMYYVFCGGVNDYYYRRKGCERPC
jgi:NNP family nitrate/nitrite transporter-like MFS transporter